MDAVDLFSAQWIAERPGLDVEPIEAWGRLKRSAHLFEKALSQVLEECDLNMSEFEVLSALVRLGAPYETRPTELTRSLIITPGAVTARLSTLERRGLIARRAHHEDGRVQLVSLSANGLRLFEPAFDRIVDTCSSILNSLSVEDRRDLHSSMRGLMSVLDSSAQRRSQKRLSAPSS
ncbi:MarR family winged helix-turn-helix transcriptional regulator [Microcella sp.]|uniref:MarR family winged helix-turn-helix transcriptional regulator n=1 Tax=Microcella sp. TaxID=1913979 RepID=UPI0025638264|nr:MarR family transcriptional regulator [Microcella sp.]MBX9472378.1 MarR family transcriptional regulator [Microcella sp.]